MNITQSDYSIGSIIEYRAYGNEIRKVRVGAKAEDVKDGRPGFDGVEMDGIPCWGYDEQIVRVIQR
jgi:hypothetical protein